MKLFSLYVFVSATSLVQSFNSVGLNKFENSANSHQGFNGMAFPQSKDSVRQFVSNKNDVYNKALFIKKPHEKTKPNPLSISEIKHVLTKVLQEVTAPLQEHKRDLTHHLHAPLKRKSKPCSEHEVMNPQWDKWTDWSPCSVTCGKGREIRWRHCLKNCEGVETEMEEKACQLPACKGKLFGFIKL